MAGLIGVEAT